MAVNRTEFWITVCFPQQNQYGKHKRLYLSLTICKKAAAEAE
jgi:hypothetical protein